PTECSYAKLGSTVQPARQDTAAWQQVDFEILSSGYSTYQIDDLGHPFAGRENCLMRVAPELRGISGIKIPEEELGGNRIPEIRLDLNQSARVLLAVFQADNEKYLNPSDFSGDVSSEPVLENALTFT